MENVTKFWDLSSPQMCRDFLKQVRIGPEDDTKSIEFLQQADGKQISIDEASDEQVLAVCQEFAEAMGKKSEPRQ